MATQRAGFTIACLLCLTCGMALELAPEWRWRRPHQPKSGEELWELGAGCLFPASDFDEPPSPILPMKGRWEKDRKFFKDFKQKMKLSHKDSRYTPRSAWEATTADLPSANKVIYFVNADGDLQNCTRCMDCRMTLAARKRVKSIPKLIPDIEQAELVVTSPMTRALDTTMDAFRGKPVLLDPRLIELAGVAVKGKGKYVIEEWNETNSLLPEYMRLWQGPYNEQDAKKRMHTQYYLMSPPAGSGNSSVQRLAVLGHLITHVKGEGSHQDAWEEERRSLHEQLDAEELPDARFAAVIKDLWQRPEQRIVVVSHSNLLHIGLGEKLSAGQVTRRGH